MAAREWSWLVRRLAPVVLVAVAAVGISSGDRETLVIATLLLVGNALLWWRSGVVGTVVVGLLAVDITFWMLPAALANVFGGERLVAVLVPAVLATGSAMLIVACVGALVQARRSTAAGPGPMRAVALGVLVLVAAGIVGLLGGTDGPEPGDVEVTAQDTAFHPDRLTVPAGPTTFYVSNDDLFWHTFSINGTDVDERLATRSHTRVTVDLQPGTYEVVCRIPGHESLGMTATLDVR